MATTFTAGERDLLAELVKSGIARSAGRMEKLTKSQWDIVSSAVAESSLDDTRRDLDADPEKHYGVHIRSRLPMPVEILLIFPYWGVEGLVETVIKGLGEGLKTLASVDQLVLCEVGNVLGQGLIASLADGLGVPLMLTVPEIRQAPQSALLSAVLEGTEARKDAILLSKVELASGEICTSCSLLLLLDVPSLKPLLARAAAKKGG